jgi:type IV pilus assembly protein PilM
MALSLRKKNGHGSVGLDIDGRYLAAIGTADGRVASAASAELPDGLVRDGEVTDPEGLARELKRFAGAAGLPRNVRLGISNQQIVVRVVELPQIENEAERESAVRFQAAETIAMPLDETILDHQVVGYGTTEEGGARMQVVLVAARRSMVESIVQAARQAGLRPESIDLDAFALVRVLGDRAASEESARVFCHLAGVTNLAIAVGDCCFFTRPLSTSWEAEDASSGLADEIRLSIDYYMTQPNARPVGEMVLSGPGSRQLDLVRELAGQLGLEARVAEPLGGLDASAVAMDDPLRYTVAAGLALGASA